MKNTENNLDLVPNLCWKCAGVGRLFWTSNANGVCFPCNGTGELKKGSDHEGAKRGVLTFRTGDVTWQFLPIGENHYHVPDAKPNDERTVSVLMQALDIVNPKKGRTIFRCVVKPDIGREAYRLASNGASVAEVEAACGITAETKPACWFRRESSKVELL